MGKQPQPRSNLPLRVGLISLGCAKNLVDAEIMLGSLLKDGVEITNDPSEADAVIVNTCSFIDAAQEESVDTILESDAVRQARNRGQSRISGGAFRKKATSFSRKTVVCLPSRNAPSTPTLLMNELPILSLPAFRLSCPRSPREIQTHPLS